MDKNDIENKNTKLGELIEEGLEEKIYYNANNKNFILNKLYSYNRDLIKSRAKKGIDTFIKYYGEGSAALIKSSDKFYIKIYKAPGVTIDNIKDKITIHTHE